MSDAAYPSVIGPAAAFRGLRSQVRYAINQVKLMELRAALEAAEAEGRVYVRRRARVRALRS
jgi:hypothetical protein